MNFGEALKTGLREIRMHVFRSILSFSAISVGVASLLYTFAQTHGSREAFDKAVALMGPGRMQIEAKRNYVSKGLSPGLTCEDAREIRRTLPELFMVYPKAKRWGETIYDRGRKVEGVPVFGVGEEWRKRDWVYALRGRFLNSQDIQDVARVCVVVEPGGWFKKPFWASWWNEDPIEIFLKRHDLLRRQLIIENHLFTVVGILKEPPKDLDPRWFHWEGNRVLVPITTFHRYFARQREGRSRTAIEEIQVDTGSEATVPGMKRRIETILKRRHQGEQDYDIQDNRDTIQEELSETQRYILVGMVLGLVALLAGGIGIMNVTLAAIFSRVKEIGIRRAVGATRADILAQFVTEAMFLGLSGGLAGLGLGYAGISYLARHSDQDLANLTWYHMAAVLSIGTAVSCLFSFYPARQAAALDPVAALKDE